jgi:FkbM family methyltransferase
MTGATGNIYFGLFEFEDMAFALHVLRPNDFFVDIGANIGVYTVLASAVARASSLAIEPVPESFAGLQRNIRMNGIDDMVQAENIAIGSEDGALSFTGNLDAVNHVLAAGEHCADVVTVQSTTLDRVVGDRSPTVIKIDVEGFEAKVLEGGTKTLSSPGLLAVVLETNESGRRYGLADEEVRRRMAEHGFTAWSYEPFGRNLISPRPGSSMSGNTIFIRDAGHVSARLKAGPSFLVHGIRI